MKIAYSRTAHPDIAGAVCLNPRFYLGPQTGVSEVLLNGDYRLIEEDYLALGVPVRRVDRVAADPPAGIARRVKRQPPGPVVDALEVSAESAAVGPFRLRQGYGGQAGPLGHLRDGEE